MGKLKEFLKRKDVVFSAHRYGIDAMGAMAQGLFASLLIGTIIKNAGRADQACSFWWMPVLSPRAWPGQQWRLPSVTPCTPRRWCCSA